MRKRNNRVMSFLLTLMMLVTAMSPLANVVWAGAADQTLDFVALAKDHHVVGNGYTVTANDDGLTITLTEKITPSSTTKAVTCDNAEILAAVGSVEYPGELNANADDPNGEKRYVAIPVSTAFDIKNNPYFTADIVAGASNSADAGWSFGIWYEGDKADGSHKNSARYTGNFFKDGTANSISFTGIGESSQVNGSWFSHDSLKYSDKGFSAYLADRSGNFKVNAAIFKVVGDVGDTFTFKTVKFETNKTEFPAAPPAVTQYVYDFNLAGTSFQGSDLAASAFTDAAAFAKYLKVVQDAGREGELKGTSVWHYGGKSDSISLFLASGGMGFLIKGPSGYASLKLVVPEAGIYDISAGVSMTTRSGYGSANTAFYLSPADATDHTDAANLITKVNTAQGESGATVIVDTALGQRELAAGEYIFTAQLPSDQTFLWVRDVTLKKVGAVDSTAAPTASPEAGRYTSTQNVVLTSATADADIYYTTDGNDPTTSSTKYTGPITVDRSMTIKAFAAKAGRTDSAIESFAYEIATPTPVIAPMNGVRFYQNLKVSIATVSGATVHYTLDGTDPSESSPTYTAPIDLTESKTVKAVAYRDGFAASEIASVDYIKVDGDAPTTLDYDFTVINQQRRTGVKGNPSISLAVDYATVNGYVDEINAREPDSAATQPWCYGGKDDGTGLFYNDNTGCRIGIGKAAEGAGMWGGYRIYIPADGTYDITAKHYVGADSLCGDVEFYLAPVTADNQIDSKYLLSGVNTIGTPLVGKETLVKEGMELTAGEYYFTAKLVNAPYLWVQGVSFTREAVVTPANEIDFVALAKDHHVVGNGYTVTANDDGLTITLTEKITPSNKTKAVTCDNAEILAAVGSVEYPGELNADAEDPNGEKRYVAIPVSTAFDIDNNPYFTADIVAGASNSADAGWSFGIWYEGDKKDGSHKNSARYTGNFFKDGTANSISFAGIGESSQVNGSWFSHDSLKYSDKGFSAYLADRSGNFKVNAAIFKVVGDVGDTFTFKTVKFETNKTEFSTAPVEHVYNFMARYQIFQNGNYNAGDYHNPAVPATDLTYDKVAEIGAAFNAFMAGHPGYSNYKTTLPRRTDAWAVLDLTPNSFTANNKDVGLWNVTKDSFISIGIKLTAAGNYDMSSWMRFYSDKTGLVNIYLAPIADKANCMDDKYLIDTVDNWRKTNVGQSLEHVTAKDLALTAGEYVVSYKMVGTSTQPGAQEQQYLGIGGIVLSPAAEQVATPVATPASGTDFHSNTTVALRCATVDATIYYTTDGSDPTEASMKYTGPIALNATTTIKAIAMKAGKTNSEIATFTYKDLDAVAAKPTAAPFNGFQFAEDSITVKLAAEAGADIYYTVNGDTPTTGSTKYSDGIVVNATTTIKAIAVKAGVGDSEVAAFTYTKIAKTTDPIVYDFRVLADAGYNSNDSFEIVPDYAKIAEVNTKLNTLEPSAMWCFGAVEEGAAIIVGAKDLGAGIKPENKWVAVRVNVPQSGKYNIRNNFWDSQDPRYAGTLTYYFNPVSKSPVDESGNIGTYEVVARAAGNMTDREIIANQQIEAGEYYFAIKLGTNAYTWLAQLKLEPVSDTPAQVEAPTASPAAGTYTSAQSVTLSTATTDADIYYTTDGNEPTTSSMKYTDAITVDKTMTIKAIAVKGGMTDSSVATFAYTINIPDNQVAAPVASRDSVSIGGTYKVRLSCATAGATIHYTTDGSEPTKSSPIYTPGGPQNVDSSYILISSTTTLKAIAVKSGMTDSTVASYTYTKLGVGDAKGNLNFLTEYNEAGVVPHDDTTVEKNADGSLTVKISAAKDASIKTDELDTFGVYLPVDKTFNIAEAPNLFWDVEAADGVKYAWTFIYERVSLDTNAVASENHYQMMGRYYGANPSIPKPDDDDRFLAGNSAGHFDVLGDYLNDRIYRNGELKIKGISLFVTGPKDSTIKIKGLAFGSDMWSLPTPTPSNKVSTPTASRLSTQIGGVYYVRLTSATKGATIHYTTDGSEPTVSSPIHTQDGPPGVESTYVKITDTTTLKAIAVKDDMTNSDVATYTYTKLGIANAKSNLNYLTEYTGSGGTSKDGTTLTKNADGTFTVSIAVAKSDTATDVPVDEPDRNGFFIPLEKNFSIAETPYLYWNVEAPAGVKYAWTLIYDNVSLDTDTVTDTYHYQMASAFYDRNPTFPRPSDTRFFEGNMINKFDLLSELPDSIFRNGTITLKGITLFVIGPKDAAIKINGLAFGSDMWSLPTPTPSDNVSAPTASPAAGTYTSAQSVTLSTATADADIYYTTDGNTPTTSSTKYTGAITVDKTMTIKAIAVKSGMTDSSVATFAYTINIAPSKVSAPTANPVAGTYTSAQSVTLSTATAGADIYYTTNGSTPTASSTKYTGAITVDKTMTIKAIAVKSGMTNSDVASFTYTINIAPSKVSAPTANPAAGTYSSTQNVTLSTATADADIYYTTNGSTPTASSTKYTGAITVDKTTTIKAIAMKSGMTNSDVVSFTYTISAAPSNKVAAPTTNPASGTSFSSVLSIRLSSATAGAQIYYTLNGSTPKVGESATHLYNGTPITITTTTTIKAIAVKTGMDDSDMTTAVFQYYVPSGGSGGGNYGNRTFASAPVANPGSGTYEKTQSVTLTSATSGATIYYTTNGNTPTTSSMKYTGAITVDKSMTIKAIAVKSGMYNSSTASFTYTIRSGAPIEPNPPTEDKFFKDVSKNDWFYDAVKFVNEKGLFKGVSATEFGPMLNMTRGMLATVLHRLDNTPTAKGPMDFNDVNASDWYADAIAWASEAKVVNGIGNGKFAPNEPITREQLAAMLYRYAQYKGYDVSVGEDTNILSFNDATAISEYAIPAIQWACGAGIMNGKSGNMLDPTGLATRAEVAAMINRFVANVVEASGK